MQVGWALFLRVGSQIPCSQVFEKYLFRLYPKLPRQESANDICVPWWWATEAVCWTCWTWRHKSNTRWLVCWQHSSLSFIMCNSFCVCYSWNAWSMWYTLICSERSLDWGGPVLEECISLTAAAKSCHSDLTNAAGLGMTIGPYLCIMGYLAKCGSFLSYT